MARIGRLYTGLGRAASVKVRSVFGAPSGPYHNAVDAHPACSQMDIRQPDGKHRTRIAGYRGHDRHSNPAAPASYAAIGWLRRFFRIISPKPPRPTSMRDQARGSGMDTVVVV